MGRCGGVDRAQVVQRAAIGKGAKWAGPIDGGQRDRGRVRRGAKRQPDDIGCKVP